jgi:hypothetical protein
MTAKFRIKLDKGWKKYKNAILPTNFKSVINNNLNNIKVENAEVIKNAIKKTITTENFEKNAPLTVKIKSSRQPLVDTGRKLNNSIKYIEIKNNEMFIGVPKTDENFNLALTLHEGATIRVTDKMRAMFNALWAVSSGMVDASILKGRAKALWERSPRNWYPLKDQTTNILIPSRPFIFYTFSNISLKNKIKENWMKILKKTFKTIARG